MKVTNLWYDEHTNKTWGTVQVPGHHSERLFVSGKLNADEFLALAGPVFLARREREA